jgi:hypothetical protein
VKLAAPVPAPYPTHGGSVISWNCAPGATPAPTTTPAPPLGNPAPTTYPSPYGQQCAATAYGTPTPPVAAVPAASVEVTSFGPDGLAPLGVGIGLVLLLLSALLIVQLGWKRR